jgi:hypothetical protein
MTPRLESCYFTELRNDPWTRLARNLAFTAAEHCQGWTVRVAALPPYRQSSAMPGIALIDGYTANTYKLDHWCQVVQDAADGTELLLIDTDTLILRPLDDVWAQPFDLAYTVRPARFPFNGGVVFLRVSAATRAFVLRWRDENRRLFRDKAAHQIERRKYGGINQAAFGALLERGEATDLRIVRLPCAEWNCEDSTWASFDPAVTRILHVKSMLRKAVLGFAGAPPALKALVQVWRTIDRAALAAEERSA